MELSFTPTFDQEEVAQRLQRLLLSGPVCDPAVVRRIERVAGAFASYTGCYPLPLWAPGLVIDNEMRGVTEALLPMDEIRPVFELVLKRGCRFALDLSGSYLQSAATWLDLLHRLRPQLGQADPSATLRAIALDDEQRRRFLFSLMLPHHFGGSFDRYPLQSQWIVRWLKENFQGRPIRALDSACGSGEGTYGLAELVLGAGCCGEGSVVEGSTIEPVELFAAAHAFFPHDPERQRSYRARVGQIIEAESGVTLRFYLDDVGSGREGEGYHLILCNGLLGGPLLHDRAALERALAALAERLAPGGVLLAADRFHEGWRLRVPPRALEALMLRHGLTPLRVPEGVAGEMG